MADEQAFEWSCGWSYVGFCGSDKLGQKDEIFDQSQRQTINPVRPTWPTDDPV
jgi:hypothetical protein